MVLVAIIKYLKLDNLERGEKGEMKGGGEEEIKEKGRKIQRDRQKHREMQGDTEKD